MKIFSPLKIRPSANDHVLSQAPRSFLFQMIRPHFLLRGLMHQSRPKLAAHLKGKDVKKNIKQEVKAAPLSSAPSTPIKLPKRPRAVSVEMPLSKRPGATTTRAVKAFTTTAAAEEEEEDDDAEEEQFEPLHKLLEGCAGASEV
jgi:hypothetical protein